MTDVDTRDPAIVELARKLLTGAAKIKGASVYRFDLQGFVSDGAAAFPDQPGDVLLDEREGVGKAIKRLMVLAVRRGTQEIQDVATVSCVLRVPHKTGVWLLHAATGEPWTVELAQQLLEACCVRPDLAMDITQAVPFGRVGVIHGRGDLERMTTVASGFHRTIGILAHAPTRVVVRQHERLLSPYAMRYRGMLCIAVHDDPSGRVRKYYGEQTFTDLFNRTHHVAMPPLGGMRVMLPLEYPRSAIPPDLPVTLDKREAADDKTVAAWLERCAALMLHPAHAPDPDAHKIVKDFEPRFARDIAADTTVSVFQELVDTRQREAELRDKLKGFIAAGDELRAHAHQTQEMWEAEQRKNAEKDREIRGLRAELATTRAQLAEARAADGGGQEHVAAVTGERDRARALLAERVEDLEVLRETLTTLKTRPEAVVPREWRQLFPFAGIFTYVDVPDWAVRPAYGVLDRGQESLGWLVRAWTVLTKLDEYAAAKIEGGAGGVCANFRTYVTEFPASGVTPRHVVLGESEAVSKHPQLRGMRTFDTPMGPRFFSEHVAIGSGAPPAPRLYYYDAVREIGKVLVAYIGPHLKNTLTN